MGNLVNCACWYQTRKLRRTGVHNKFESERVVTDVCVLGRRGICGSCSRGTPDVLECRVRMGETRQSSSPVGREAGQPELVGCIRPSWKGHDRVSTYMLGTELRVQTYRNPVDSTGVRNLVSADLIRGSR